MNQFLLRTASRSLLMAASVVIAGCPGVHEPPAVPGTAAVCVTGLVVPETVISQSTGEGHCLQVWLNRGVSGLSRIPVEGDYETRLVALSRRPCEGINVDQLGEHASSMMSGEGLIRITMVEVEGVASLRTEIELTGVFAATSGDPETTASMLADVTYPEDQGAQPECVRTGS